MVGQLNWKPLNAIIGKALVGRVVLARPFSLTFNNIIDCLDFFLSSFFLLSLNFFLSSFFLCISNLPPIATCIYDIKTTKLLILMHARNRNVYIIYNIFCINIQLIQKHNHNSFCYPNIKRIKIREVVEVPHKKVMIFTQKPTTQYSTRRCCTVTSLPKSMIKMALFSPK